METKLIAGYLNWATETLRGWGVGESLLHFCATLLIAGGALLLAWLLYFVVTRYVIPAVLKLVSITDASWDDILFNERLLRVVAELACVMLMQATIPDGLTYYPTLHGLAVLTFRILIVCVAVHLINRFLLAVYELIERSSSGRASSLKGIRQMLQVISVSIGVIIIISILANKNPLTVITGLGAAATVLMLVFKDSIMGVVAGVQLTLNDMLRPGDWITVPARNINGTVLEVGLTTVKVQNFDMTIVTIPPYALVSESFQNWRGMTDSRGRRINRAVTIDVNSVRFCDEETIRELKNEEWWGQLDHSTPHVNLTLFRKYLEHYISTLPEMKTDANMVYMVRELAPTPEGIPLELYFFTSLTSWKPYEHFQAQVIDHVLASVHRFGLRIYQAPSGRDVAMLANARNA
ncbi:mechanosensitive ion channel domain-containing protein [uncultured Duncaniella sp.]|uniref:mechanosensitive ion channel family protein n=1 Tax=uncultured Duncaniella sp. TaxID=2768039 RepID=UPI0025A9ED24|nr:mechanosensitive ion channel domain-containing protein [uncultured Duncaniella sp.]